MSKRSADYERWTKEEALRFIIPRIKLDDLFTNKTFDQKEAWQRVGWEALVEKPHDKLKRKWQNLLVKYKQIKEPASGISTEDGGYPTSWPFYDELDGFLSSRHNINPRFLINSSLENQTETPEPPESERLFNATNFEESESHVSFGRVFSSTPTRSSRSQSLSSVGQLSQTSRGSRRSTPNQVSSTSTASENSRQVIASTRGHTSTRRRLTALEVDEMKTNKKIRKMANLIEKYMHEKFNVSVESSDSD